MNLTAAVSVLTLITHWVSAVSFVPAYCADGIVTYQHLADGTNVAFEQTYRFSVMEDETGRWRLEIATTLPIAKVPLSTREIISFDGKNIYSALYSSQVVLTPVGENPQVVSADPHQVIPARVCAGPYPIDHSSVAGFIWLAFIGGEYVSSTSGVHRFPNLLVSNARKNPEAWSCDLDCTLIPLATKPLIGEARFILNPAYLSANQLDYPDMDAATTPDELESLQKVLLQCQSLLGALRTRAELRVVQTDKFNGLVVPVKINCVVFPTSGTGRGRFEGLVTNLSAREIEGLLPTLNTLAQVEDRRVRFKTDKVFLSSVSYPLQKGEWIVSTNDSRIRTVVSKAQPLQIVKKTFRGAYKNVIITVFCIVFLAPVLLLIVARLRRKRASQLRAS